MIYLNLFLKPKSKKKKINCKSKTKVEKHKCFSLICFCFYGNKLMSNQISDFVSKLTFFPNRTNKNSDI